ncbi:DUF4249 domain-containing protein [Pontibacter harenae]|uniref:DUF4249 domain-containing protein n=1 Tax=Pontibacter harenae TaxID=2894083 RepID=UPI001E367F9E|nr:DUF4249 domain-containing protein [Pontibacter harenae]MCC9166935.1 DUF4249 domain-containing protein [Pontibacter harenae]
MKIKILLYFLTFFFLSSCSIDDTIEMGLPPHDPQLVLECYLEDGKPMRATVLESSNYFDAPTPPLVPDAQVTIAHNGRKLDLTYNPTTEGSPTKLYTHAADEDVQFKAGDFYTIEVTDGRGRKVTGNAKVLPTVPIRSIKWHFDGAGKAMVSATLQDKANTANYYRFMIHRDNIDSGSDVNLVASDELRDGKVITFGTSYTYERGDTLIVSLYHIDKQHYDFFQSVANAKEANGNPFAEPTKILSSVNGGFGIFTTLVVDRKKIVIE